MTALFLVFILVLYAGIREIIFRIPHRTGMIKLVGISKQTWTEKRREADIILCEEV